MALSKLKAVICVFAACVGVSSGALAASWSSYIDFSTSRNPDEALLTIDPSKFSNPTRIDNDWWPLKPGTQLIYDGFTVDEGKKIPHRIIITVTDLTKTVYGIPCVVIWERDYSNGRLEEAELACFAQDDQRNVWHLGQHYEVYEDGEFIGARAWFMGHVDGARAGIMVPGDARLGTPSISQGYAPAPYNWQDRCRVSRVRESTRTPYGTFDDVIVLEEFTASEPGAIQTKYYARGVGNVRVGWAGDDESQETLELVEIRHLNSREMAEVRQEAHAIEIRANVYSTTDPAR